MSLVEVVMAILVLAILSSITLNIYLTGMSASMSHQNREVAITVANQAMETVTGWTTTRDPMTGVNTLYTGRSSSAVNQQWNAASGTTSLAETYPAWDPTASASATPDLPLETVSEFTGTEFESQLYIGACYQPVSGGDCAKLAAHPTRPASAPTGYAELIRVVVVVTWTNGSCGTDNCTYETTTLIDPGIDLEWVTNS